MYCQFEIFNYFKFNKHFKKQLDFFYLIGKNAENKTFGEPQTLFNLLKKTLTARFQRSSIIHCQAYISLSNAIKNYVQK